MTDSNFTTVQPEQPIQTNEPNRRRRSVPLIIIKLTIPSSIVLGDLMVGALSVDEIRENHFDDKRFRHPPNQIKEIRDALESLANQIGLHLDRLALIENSYQTNWKYVIHPQARPLVRLLLEGGEA